jgi:hypothetical protein
VQAPALRRSSALGSDRRRDFLVREPACSALCKAATSNLRENKRCNARIGNNVRLIFKTPAARWSSRYIGFAAVSPGRLKTKIAQRVPCLSEPNSCLFRKFRELKSGLAHFYWLISLTSTRHMASCLSVGFLGNCFQSCNAAVSELYDH